MKAGAIEFLTKPFSDKELLDAIAGAIAQYRQDGRKTSNSSNSENRLRNCHLENARFCH